MAGPLTDFITSQSKKHPGRVGTEVPPPGEVISTGIPALDKAIKLGGAPRGIIVEIFGDEAVGKSALAMVWGASIQKNVCGNVLWIDMERRFWGAFALMLGMDPDRLVYARPMVGEEALQILEDAIDADIFDFIVLDSVAALVTEDEAKGDIGDTHIAPTSKLMAEALRKIGPKVAEKKCIVVFINQKRSKPMVMFGKNEDTAGGRALKFWASLRLELKRLEQIKLGDDVVGHRVRVIVEKSSVAPPYGKGEYDFRFDSGIDIIGNLIEEAISLNIITQVSSWFYLANTDKKWNGKKAIDVALRSDPVFCQHIMDLIAVVRQKAGMPSEIKEGDSGEHNTNSSGTDEGS